MSNDNFPVMIAISGAIFLGIMGGFIALDIPGRTIAAVGIGIGGSLIIGAGAIGIYRSDKG